MTPPTPRLRRQAAFTLGVLGIQFLLGMIVNLYVQIPAHHPGSSGPGYFGRAVHSETWAITHEPLVLALHIVVGLALFITALVLLIRAIRTGRRRWIIATSVGIFGVIVAGIQGASFLNYNSDAISSLIMAVGFAVATTAYIIVISIADPVVATIPETTTAYAQRAPDRT